MGSRGSHQEKIFIASHDKSKEKIILREYKNGEHILLKNGIEYSLTRLQKSRRGFLAIYSNEEKILRLIISDTHIFIRTKKYSLIGFYPIKK